MAHFSRYAFRRHFYQFAGFRLCRSVNFNEDPPVVLVPQINAEQGKIIIRFYGSQCDSMERNR